MLSNKLGQLLSDYSGRVRRYQSLVNSQIDSMAGLPERDIAILEFIHGKNEATFGQIADELIAAEMPQASESTVSQAVTAMFVKRELVAKRFDPKDQRRPLITLTEKGKALVEEIQRVRRQVLIEVRNSLELSDGEAAMLEDALERGIGNFDKLLKKKEDQYIPNNNRT